MSHPPAGGDHPVASAVASPVAPPVAPAAAPGGCSWRIDDLARRADLTVDTIRYYQREGLMPAAERAGRSNLYGPGHLERLERIKDLQSRRFSLAAIRALLSEDRIEIVDGIFGGPGGRTYTLDELVERSGIDPELAQDVRAAGLLRDPADFGRDAYDRDDLDLLRALGELHQLGIPRPAVVEVGRTYAEGIEATQRRIVELFATGGDLDWTGESLAEFRDNTAVHVAEILPIAHRIVEYTHQRTIQRLTLGAIGVDAATPSDEPEPDEA
jgi:DNA-binding transcriptional MerR regulator